MRTSRLEAFSDGVLAIVITIMVLELRVPQGEHLADLAGSATSFLTYLLSFVYIGIYWNNHHHMFQLVQRVDGTVLWANLHLLFWLSLVPFVTGWMGENHFAPLPTAVYGGVLLLSGVAYTILLWVLVAAQNPGSKLEVAVGADVKGKLSMALYALAIPLAFVNQWIAHGLYVLVALVWLVPDPRIETRLNE